MNEMVEKPVAKKTKDNRLEGCEQALKCGINHVRFQKQHATMKVLEPKGHWQSFCRALADDQPLTCVACATLHKVYVLGELEEEEEVAAGKTDMDSPLVRKRGRPRKGTTVSGFLQGWLDQNRPGIYTPLHHKGDFIYQCAACQKEIQFFRDSHTYVHHHEQKSVRHQMGLARLGISNTGDELDGRAVCEGVCVTDGNHLLGHLPYSLNAWIHAGQPVVLNDGSPFENVSWRASGDLVYARHVQCAGDVSAQGCSKCVSIVSNKKLAMEIASWGWKVDLTSLAYLMAYGKEDDIAALKLQMKTRDYKTRGLAGQDMDNWFSLARRPFISRVRKVVESVGKAKRNPAYQSFVDLRLSGLAEYSFGDLQQNMFANMINNFQSSILDGSCIPEDKVAGCFREV